jgi:hypothetical protein
MTRRKYTEVPEKVVCRCWVGRYRGGSLGWLMPRFLDRGTALDSAQQDALRRRPADLGSYRYIDSDMYRVKVTLEPVTDSRGRPIMRRTRKS